MVRRASRVLIGLLVVACSTSNDGDTGSSVEDLNANPQLSDFVLYADESITIAGNTSVSGATLAFAKRRIRRR